MPRPPDHAPSSGNTNTRVSLVINSPNGRLITTQRLRNKDWLLTWKRTEYVSNVHVHVTGCKLKGIGYVTGCKLKGIGYVTGCKLKGIGYVTGCKLKGIGYVTGCKLKGIGYVTPRVKIDSALSLLWS